MLSQLKEASALDLLSRLSQHAAQVKDTTAWIKELVAAALEQELGEVEVEE